MRPKILLIEDEDLIIEMLLEFFQITQQNYEVKVARSLSEARSMLNEHDFSLCISDCGLTDGFACELFEEGLMDMPVIITTGYTDKTMLDRLTQKNTHQIQILPKPYHPQNLVQLINTLIKKI